MLNLINCNTLNLLVLAVKSGCCCYIYKYIATNFYFTVVVVTFCTIYSSGVHYEVVLKVSNSTESKNHGPESGKLSVTLVDRNNNKSDYIFLNDEQ